MFVSGCLSLPMTERSYLQFSNLWFSLIACVKLLSTWCFRPRLLLILIFASYTQKKLRGVKAGKQISFEWCPFYAQKTDSTKTNSSRTSPLPLHTRNTGRQRGIFHWTNAQRMSADAVTEIRRKSEKLSKISGTVSHSTAVLELTSS